MIKISDIFNEYKIKLKEKIKNKSEYSVKFKIESLNNFTIENFFSFLKDHLKGDFSIVKRDITNYNLYIEVLTTFNEFKVIYQNNVDLEIK